MLKENQLVEIPWTQTAQNRYNKMGYSLQKGDTIYVKPEELPQGSQREVIAVCDICGKEIKCQYRQYLKRIQKHDGHYYCKTCFGNSKELQKIKNEKAKKTNLEKYRCENVLQLKEVQDKIKQTTKERYGVEYACQSLEVKEKIKNTCLKKYGVDSYVRTPEMQKKAKEAVLAKYGVEYAFQIDGVKEKAIQTCRKKYGCDYIFQNKELLQKAQETLAKKTENIACSSQQFKIFTLLQNEYEKVYLNYPLSKLNLDVAIFINDIKIDIEYDGWYWHQDQQKDIKRDRVVQKEGYKVLRIKGDHSIPDVKEIVEKINWLLEDNHYYTEIILEDYKKQTNTI